MFFKNYQVFIFNEKTGTRRSFYFRGVFLGVGILLIMLLIASNFFLGRYYLETHTMNKQLLATERTLEDKETDLVVLLTELDGLRNEIHRIRQFDNKLRLLVGDEKREDVAIGGASPDVFSVDMLPLHRQELAARKIRSFIADLKRDVQLEELVQQDLLLYMRENKQRLAATPSIWPVDGFVTSPFGYRTSPFTGARRFHKGIDIAAPRGTSVVAPADGRVVFAENDGAYGLSVEIDHGGGIATRYAHLHKFHVKKGDTVKRGTLIGEVGSTGRSTGPHLHYEVLVNGVPTNPKTYVVTQD